MAEKLEKKLLDIFSRTDYLSKKEKDQIKEAYYFAKKRHAKQRRSSGEPYFVHLVATVNNLVDLKMNHETIIAGFLHDAIEDGVATKEEILDKFGKTVSFLVEGVTKLGKVRFRGMERHNESLRKLFVATSQDIRVLIIKFADRLHNIQTLEFVREDKRSRIAKETLDIYAPLAYRLGMSFLSKQLEDSAFPYVYPDEFRKVKVLLNERKKQNKKWLNKFANSLRKKIIDGGVKKFRTERRIKGIYSLYKKLLRKKWDMSKIYDVAAFRIIVNDVKTCYEVLGIIHQNYRPMPGRIKDYIALPKPNGYKSIHTTVFTGEGSVMEIQIRTEEMHHWAVYGAASNINYKAFGSRIPSTQEKDWVSKLFGVFKSKGEAIEEKKKKDKKSEYPWLLNLAESSEQDPDRIEYGFKDDYFSHRIFVFTPIGDVVDLPINATVVDFAFQIHTDLGLTITGAEVNGKYKSLDTPLESGDIVKIFTKKGSEPNKKWLKFVKTDIALKKIRTYWENKEKKDAKKNK